MDTEKSHNLLYESWRPRKASGVVSVQTRMPENQGTDGIRPGSRPKTHEPGALCLRAGKLDVPIQTERENSPFFASLIYSALSRLGQAHTHWGGQSSSLNLLIPMLMSSEPLSETHPEIMSYQQSGHPLGIPQRGPREYTASDRVNMSMCKPRRRA